MNNNAPQNTPKANFKVSLATILISFLCVVSIALKVRSTLQDKINNTPAHKTTHTKIMLNNNAYAVNLGRPEKRDFWKTSDKMCKKNGMKLPTKEELLKIHFEYNKIPQSGWYWTADGAKNDDDAYRIYFNLETGDATVSNWGISDGGDMVLCVKNKI